MKQINHKTLVQAVRSLARIDSDLAKIAADLGPPPIWARQQGFCTLVHIILEQQVSLVSARAAFDRLLSVANPLTPERFLRLSDCELKAVGFSRQKTSYARSLASAIVQRDLDIGALESMDDECVRSELMKIKGIGRWTSDIYLLMALRRPDVWPKGDLALVLAVQQIKALRQRPTEEELAHLSSQWQPWRSVAARLLWHKYLSRPSAEQFNKARSRRVPIARYWVEKSIGSKPRFQDFFGPVARGHKNRTVGETFKHSVAVRQRKSTKKH